MALIPSLGTALSGMKTAQSQLSIISSNVANVDTEGYTRKIAQQKTSFWPDTAKASQLGKLPAKLTKAC